MIKYIKFRFLIICFKCIVGSLERVPFRYFFFTHNNKIRKIFVFVLVVCGFPWFVLVFYRIVLLTMKEVSNL